MSFDYLHTVAFLPAEPGTWMLELGDMGKLIRFPVIGWRITRRSELQDFRGLEGKAPDLSLPIDDRRSLYEGAHGYWADPVTMTDLHADWYVVKFPNGELVDSLGRWKMGEGEEQALAFLTRMKAAEDEEVKPEDASSDGQTP
jgi:hypothetical protein